MDMLHKKINAEKENVETALKNLNFTMSRNEKSVVELAAIGTFLHNIYNGMENILKQIIYSLSFNNSKPLTFFLTLSSQ